MLNVAICNDEDIVVNSLEMMLETICSKRLILCEFDVFYRSKLLEKQITNGKRYDIIFYGFHKAVEDEIAAWKNIRKLDKEVLLTINEQIYKFTQNYPTRPKTSSSDAPFLMNWYSLPSCSIVSCFCI